FSTDPARRLVLGGVEVEGPGLSGHSDADAVAHAVSDALLGAAGLSDLGTRFPASDPTLRGVDSMHLLAQVVATVGAGFAVGNVDVTLIADSPRLGAYTEEMAARLGAVVGAPVSVKAKRAEQLGALGRNEGIACLAVALLVQT
ncbi:MAG: 2-C-methyl-D-erythritol 2,4-cyclodiphosphate synthase, partial [Candidatus Dormibacteria bacterium]